MTLTKDQLVDNFKGKKYKWSEINRIDLRLNAGKAPGSHIALYLENPKDVIVISDIKLRGKKMDIFEDLVGFHNRYRDSAESLNSTDFD